MKTSIDVDSSLLYPNMVFQVLKNQGCPAKPTLDLAMESPLTFSKTLFTSDRVKDMPYTRATIDVVSSDEDDSTFEVIRNYKDTYVDVGPFSINNTAVVRKELIALPLWIKKVKGLVHALKDAQDVL